MSSPVTLEPVREPVGLEDQLQPAPISPTRLPFRIAAQPNIDLLAIQVHPPSILDDDCRVVATTAA